MVWLSFALSTAFFESVKDVFSKQGLKKSDEYVVAWALCFFTTLLLIPFLWLFKLPNLSESFGFALFMGGTFNTVAMILYIKAIKESDLSISLPMIALTPLFMLITSPLIVGEWPDFYDFVGILFIVTGSYLLNIKEKSNGYLAPLKALLKQTGPKYMLGVAFLWSISSNFDKVGVQSSSAIFWLFSVFGTMSILLLPALLYKSQKPVQKLIKGLPILLPMGIVNTLAVFFQMQALTLTLVVQVIAIKRTSVLMGVLWGHFLFKEQNIQERLAGSALMILGVFIMSLF